MISLLTPYSWHYRMLFELVRSEYQCLAANEQRGFGDNSKVEVNYLVDGA